MKPSKIYCKLSSPNLSIQNQNHGIMLGSYLKKGDYTTTPIPAYWNGGLMERPQKLLIQSHPESNVIPPGPCAGLF